MQSRIIELFFFTVGGECDADWRRVTKIPDEFKLKMLQFCHPASVSQSENGECLSLDRNFGRINLVLAEGQN